MTWTTIAAGFPHHTPVHLGATAGKGLRAVLPCSTVQLLQRTLS